MADREIVIKIPEEEYELCKKQYDTECLDVLMIAVKYGIPLPKGHGDLIDRKDLIENGTSKGFCDWYDEIKMADTIIEADRGNDKSISDLLEECGCEERFTEFGQRYISNVSGSLRLYDPYNDVNEYQLYINSSLVTSYKNYYDKVEDNIKHEIESTMKSEAINDFVKGAFINASKIQFGDKNYQEVMLAQRIAGPTNAGSSYEDITDTKLKIAILSANWSETTHKSVDAEKGYRVFTTKDLPKGIVGIADIKEMPENAEFYAIDPKHTGNISIGISSEYMKDNAPVTNTTYLITGPEMINGKELQVVQTFHPGEPVSPSIISTEEIKDGTKLSKYEATHLGFDKCKFISPEMIKEYNKENEKASIFTAQLRTDSITPHRKGIKESKDYKQASDRSSTTSSKIEKGREENTSFDH